MSCRAESEAEAAANSTSREVTSGRSDGRGKLPPLPAAARPRDIGVCPDDVADGGVAKQEPGPPRLRDLESEDDEDRHEPGDGRGA